MVRQRPGIIKRPEEDRQMQRSSRFFTVPVSIVSGLFVSLLWLGQAIAAEPIVLRFATYVSETAPTSLVDRWFAEQLEKRTGGKVKVQFFWSGQLGGSREMLGLLSKGTVDLAHVSPLLAAERFPISNELIHLVAAHGFGQWERSALWYDLMTQRHPEVFEAEEAQNNVKHLRVGAFMPYNLMSTKKITKLDDLRGLKVRAVGAAFVKYWNAANMVPVSLGFAETYEALARGTIDLSPIDNIYANSLSLQEVGRFFYVVDLPVAMIFMGIHLDRWNSLPADVQRVMKELRVEAAQYSFDFLKENEDKIRMTELKDVVNTRATPEDIARWKAAFPDVDKDAVDAMSKIGKGPEMTRILEQFRALRGK
jgi:TRAP-type C4-dicarboxylate transport system substrate-binding protein